MPTALAARARSASGTDLGVPVLSHDLEPRYAMRLLEEDPQRVASHG